jgi:hypothetical protein
MIQMHHKIGHIVIPLKSVIRISGYKRYSLYKREYPYLLSIITKEFIEQNNVSNSLLFHFPVIKWEQMENMFFEQYNYNYNFYMKEHDFDVHYKALVPNTHQ